MMTTPVLTTAFPARVVFVLAAIFVLSPFADPPVALLTGLMVSLIAGNPFAGYTRKYMKLLLQVSVVGLGFGLNAQEAASAGRDGFFVTLISISLTLAAGLLIGRIFRLEKKTSFLLSSGTAICGGSAIAAISPLVRADEKQMSVSLGIIFFLNSLALLIFPFLGKLFHLSQTQFGLWSAIAIHDTSSVVGAAAKFGDQALEVATTVKLVRTLWIIPLSLFTAMVFRSSSRKISIPWFILFFFLAMMIHTLVPAIEPLSNGAVLTAKKGLALTLFLIGNSMSISSVKSMGWKPFLAALILWILVSTGSLAMIRLF